MHLLLNTTLWACLLFCLVCDVDLRETCGKTTASGRIKNGDKASIEQFPWTVSLRGEKYNGDVKCGGSIIGRRWILTAAHCVDENPHWVTVGKTEGKSIKLEDLFYIKHSTKHPKYRKVTAKGKLVSKRDDIALLELAAELPRSASVRPICLSRKDVKTNQQCQVAGWGDTDGLANPSKQLMKINVKIAANCDDKKYLAKPQDNICTQKATQQACKGDSGGPLMCKEENGQYFLKGVFNSATKCRKTRGSAVFAKVANYMEWIKQVTKLDFRGLTEDGPGTHGRMYHEIANAGSGIDKGVNASNIPNLPAISTEYLPLPRPEELKDRDGSYTLDGGDNVKPEPRGPDFSDDSKRTSGLDNHDGAPMSINSASRSLTTSKIFLFVGVPIFIMQLIVVLVVVSVWLRKSSHQKNDNLEMAVHLPEPESK